MTLPDYKYFIILPSILLSSVFFVEAQNNPEGFYLQTQGHGELWQLSTSHTQPQVAKHLKTPAELWQAINLTKTTLKNSDLTKIPVGVVKITGRDTDMDGLNDDLEAVLGTSPSKKDSDKDGYSDLVEITNNYNPLGVGKIAVDQKISNKYAGKILSDEKKHLWYLSPTTKRRYFLADQGSAWQAIPRLSTSMSNADAATHTSTKTTPTTPIVTNSNTSEATTQLRQLANLIASGNDEEAGRLVTPDLNTILRLTIRNQKPSERVNFAALLNNAYKKSADDRQVILVSKIYFSLSGRDEESIIIITKQTDGKWLISKL